MKNLILAAGLALSVVVTATAAESRFQAAGTPVDLGAPESRGRFTMLSDFMPSDHIGSSAWWRGDTAMGNWWGGRSILDDAGVEITASYLNNIAGNATGGKTKGFTYA